jgi:hypothetical protein
MAHYSLLCQYCASFMLLQVYWIYPRCSLINEHSACPEMFHITSTMSVVDDDAMEAQAGGGPQSSL